MAKRHPDIPVGTRSGQLEVVELLPDHHDPSGRRYQRVRARCDCGNTLDVMAVRIRLGSAIQCHACAHDRQVKYRAGARYDQIVIESFYRDGGGRRMAQCRCDCGNETSVFVGLLDSTQGYTLANVQWVHKDVNRMKNALPLDRFLELCRLISDHHGDTCSPTMPNPPKPRPRRRPGKVVATSTG